jgi:hypothetical protein
MVKEVDLCRYFDGDIDYVDKPNNYCGKDGGNCDNPTKPCN